MTYVPPGLLWPFPESNHRYAWPLTECENPMSVTSRVFVVYGRGTQPSNPLRLCQNCSFVGKRPAPMAKRGVIRQSDLSEKAESALHFLNEPAISKAISQKRLGYNQCHDTKGLQQPGSLLCSNRAAKAFHSCPPDTISNGRVDCQVYNQNGYRTHMCVCPPAQYSLSDKGNGATLYAL